MNQVRLTRIRAVLKKHGPMTIVQISEVTGYSTSNIAAIIYEFRLHPGKKTRIRKCGRVREMGTMPRYVFELSNEPDADSCAPNSSPAKPSLTREEIAEIKQRRELAMKIKPFRHWQDVAFFGAPA